MPIRSRLTDLNPLALVEVKMIRTNAPMMRTLVGFFFIGLVAGAAVPALAGSSGTWATTGSLNIARSGHTATLLPDGQVLVAGGCCDASGNVLASAELYDPATGQWTVTDSMTTARWGHSATRLPNGEVLVAGGSITSGIAPIATAELYNPSTGKWTTTGQMTTARCFQGAALLANGQVLVAGGDSPGTDGTLTAELYSPTTGQWTVTGSMVDRHIGAQAARLQDGRVLMAGGSESRVAEIYSNGHWTLTSPSNSAHPTASTALLTDGDVLVVGGLTEELYNPANNTWVETDSLGIGNFSFGPLLRLLSDKVLLAGATRSYRGLIPTAKCELYDSSTNFWVVTGSMNTARSGHTITLLPSGQVLATGGTNIVAGKSTFLASVELYTP
jgi:Galactose oxidase, central domain